MSAPDVPEQAAETLETVRQQRAGLRTASEGVERAVAAPATARVREWADLVRERLADVEKAFDRHMAVTEAPDGLFAEVVARAPRLARRVQKLQGEHAVIRSQLERVKERSKVVVEDDVDAVRDDALSLLNLITKHRHTGADLVYEAYWVDVEAGD